MKAMLNSEKDCPTIPPVPTGCIASAAAAQLAREEETPWHRMVVVTDAAHTPDAVKGGVLLLGNFDGFHRGHQVLLDVAMSRAGSRPIGLMSVEPHPRQFFAPQSGAFRLTTPLSKLDVLARFGAGFVYSPRFDADFAGQSPEQFVQDILVSGLGVSHLVVGRDFRFGARRGGDVGLLERLGRDLEFSVDALEDVRCDEVRCSSTLVRDLLKAGDVEAANTMLGYAWSVELRVPDWPARHSGSLPIAWPDHVIVPGQGTYRVALRQAGESAPLHVADLTVDGCEQPWLLMDQPSGIVLPEAGRLLVDFLARIG